MFRSRGQGGTSPDRRPLGRRCTARVDSADAGLYFEAALSYEWTLVERAEERILHPDEVARSLLVGTVRAATAEYPVLHVDEAEWAANRDLSREITADERITVRGHVCLGVPVEVEAQARARYRASEQVRLREVERTARLEVLQELLMSKGLGLVWWLERHEGPSADMGPKQWTRELIESYEGLAAALRRDHASTETEEDALLRSRVEEALALVEDPEVAGRFARHLGDYVARITGKGSSPE